jgi:hypothetical protein
MEDEDDGLVAPGGVGGPDHPEDWKYLGKYSHVGTERAAAPSVPQYATRSACGGASRVISERNAQGVAAHAGDCACA